MVASRNKCVRMEEPCGRIARRVVTWPSFTARSSCHHECCHIFFASDVARPRSKPQGATKITSASYSASSRAVTLTLRSPAKVYQRPRGYRFSTHRDVSRKSRCEHHTVNMLFVYLSARDERERENLLSVDRTRRLQELNTMSKLLVPNSRGPTNQRRSYLERLSCYREILGQTEARFTGTQYRLLSA